MNKNTHWNLDALYLSLNHPKFQEDYKELSESVEKIRNWTASNLNNYENFEAKLIEYIEQLNYLEDLSERLMDYGELRLSTNTDDEEALKLIDRLEELLSDLAAPQTCFQHWVCNSPSLPRWDESSILKEHQFFIEELIENGSHLLSEKEEALLEKMKSTGSSAFGRLQENTAANLMVEITLDGIKKRLPLAEIRNLAYSGSPYVRKTAYEAELASYEAIAPISAACLNSIKGEVITECKLRGYASPLEMTLKNSRLTQKTLDAMLTAIKESLPMFHQYFRKKSALLGHKEALPFYDLFAPLGKMDRQYTYEEAQTFVINTFATFSSKLANYAKNAFDNCWIDVYPQQGKRGGAFCSNLHSIKESRILTNFTGSFSDVITLAHELGHGYHGFCLDNQSAINSDYPMPIAETASTFCETIVKTAALKDASDEETLGILEIDLSDAAQVVVDIYSRFLFEDQVFKKRAEGPLSASELNKIMLCAQRDAYGEGLDPHYLHPYMWVCKSHYYDAAYNYYNFPYAFGLLLAKGLYAKYTAIGEEFLPQYDLLLSRAGSTSLENLAKEAGIDLTDISFWKSSLKMIEKDIRLFLEK